MNREELRKWVCTDTGRELLKKGQLDWTSEFPDDVQLVLIYALSLSISDSVVERDTIERLLRHHLARLRNQKEKTDG